MIPELTPAEIARFYGRLQLGGCGVLWAGPVNNHGYGRFEIYRDGRRVRILAHRLIYKLSTGTDPGERKMRHGCDTPPCCTLDCLEPGTQRDNVHDAIDRGRFNGTGLLIPHRQLDAAVAQRLDIGAKRCGRCRSVKAMDQFSRSRRNADGRQYWCKKCMVDQQRRHRQAARQEAA